MNRCGSSLVVSLGIIVVLSTLGSSMLTRGVTESQIGARSALRQSAFFLAEAAADQAIANLRANLTADLPTTTLADGTYWAEITLVSGTTYQITAHGLNASEQRNLELTVRLASQSPFRYALFGDDALKMQTNAVTDSYDSRDGDYDPSTAGSNGSIGTNSTTINTVKLENGIAINGQVVVGSGLATPSDVVTTDATVVITGSPQIASASHALNLPAVDPSMSSCTTDLKLAGSEVFTFQESDSPYCYNEIKLEGDSSVQVSGDVVVFTKKMAIENTSSMNVNGNGRPTQLLVQVTTNGNVTFKNVGQFSGAIYAPESTVTSEDAASIFGAIVAKDMVVEDSALIHYDEALGESTNVPSGRSTVTLLSWREL